MFELPALGGGTVSVFSANDMARGVIERGMEYSIDDEPLSNRTSRGLSNELTGEEAAVAVEEARCTCSTRWRKTNAGRSRPVEPPAPPRVSSYIDLSRETPLTATLRHNLCSNAAGRSPAAGKLPAHRCAGKTK
ncbi:MAG: hypothetical protein ACLR3C_13155 [Eggerthella lenta]